VLGARVVRHEGGAHCRRLVDKRNASASTLVCPSALRLQLGAVLDDIDDDLGHVDVDAWHADDALQALKADAIGRVENPSGETVVYLNEESVARVSLH